jgi:hypothetical protein
MMNRIFVNRLLGRSWLGGEGRLVREKHILSKVLCSVITSELTVVLSLSSSFETFLQNVIPHLAVLCSSNQRPHHTNCSHVQGH